MPLEDELARARDALGDSATTSRGLRSARDRLRSSFDGRQASYEQSKRLIGP